MFTVMFMFVISSEIYGSEDLVLVSGSSCPSGLFLRFGFLFGVLILILMGR